MNPWEQYAPPDPRADPNNWDPFGLYIGPTDVEPDYHGGTISTEYYPDPTIFAPGSSYTQSGRESVAPPPQTSPPATAPASFTSHVSPDVRWAPASSASVTAPATAPATAPTPTEAWGGQSASTPTSSGDLPAYGRAAGANESAWGEPASRPPATSLQAINRWDNPIYSRYFEVLGASQPARVKLIRGLPGSVHAVPQQGFTGQPQRQPLARPHGDHGRDGAARDAGSHSPVSTTVRQED